MQEPLEYTKPKITISIFNKEDVIRTTGPGPGPICPFENESSLDEKILNGEIK